MERNAQEQFVVAPHRIAGFGRELAVGIECGVYRYFLCRGERQATENRHDHGGERRVRERSVIEAEKQSRGTAVGSGKGAEGCDFESRVEPTIAGAVADEQVNKGGRAGY